MKEQYVGDINDYRKYALLRALSASGKIKIGVCWMLTPSDGSTDGNKLSYLKEPEQHRHFDPELFDILAHTAAEPGRRRLQGIEDSKAVPGATYFNNLLPDDVAGRQNFMEQCRTALAATDLIFLDPDNGLEVPSVRIGRKRSSKYIYLTEISDFYASGKSLLIYQHFPRVKRETFIAKCTDRLGAIAGDATVWTYRTKHVVFLLLINPRSNPALSEAARLAAARWDESFISGSKMAGEGTSLGARRNSTGWQRVRRFMIKTLAPALPKKNSGSRDN